MTGHATRRSSRSQSQKQNNEQSLVNTGRSRSTSAYRSSSQRRGAKSTPITEKSSPRKRKRSLSSSDETPKVLKRSVDGRIVDAYCWVCHKAASESICNSCPRVYHKECLKKIRGNSNQLPACECHLKTVDGKNGNLNLDVRELKKLLQYVMQEAIKEEKKNNQKSHQAGNSKFCTLFQAWSSEDETLCNVMDLNILLDNMNGEEPYSSTGKFFLDVKWIYHNCYILYGPDSEATEAASKLEKNFKQELTDVEACPECYYNKSDYLHADFFTKVCRKPHSIVWAKLRGSPFWPAKCLKIHNGHADVRFFGTHDKSKIAIDKCYKISRENPLNKPIKQAKYKDAIRELSIYVSNYESLIGPFHFYPRKTVLEDGNAGVKKSSKKGRQRLNNVEPVDRNVENSGSEVTRHSEINSDPMETKVRTSFPFLGNFRDNERNKNTTDSVREADIDSNVVCHMTFIADEHNGPVSELNNPEEIIGSSAPHCSLSEASLNPSLPLSSLETPSLLSTGVLPSSSGMDITAEAHQNSLNFLNVNSLPVITSVSANEMPLNELPVINSALCNGISPNTMSDGPSTSNSFPVITSTVSTSEGEGFASNTIFDEEENVKVPVNVLNTEESSVPLSKHLYNTLLGETNFDSLLEDNDANDEEIQVVGEERQSSIAQDCIKNPAVLKAFAEVLFSSRPHLKKSFLSFHTYVMQYFLLMWIEVTFSKFEKRDVKNFIELLRKSIKKQDILKKSLSKSESDRLEAEKARLEADKAKLEAEKGRKEAENAKAKLEEELKELKKQVENLGQGQFCNQKSELKDMIILRASQKMQSKSDKNSEEINSLSMLLSEARQKINIKEEDIDKLREENEMLKSLLINAKSKTNVCDSVVQTEENNFESLGREIEEFNEAFVLNQTQDSSQLNKNILENPTEILNISQEQQGLTQAEVQVEMQRKMYIIERLSSVSSNTSLNTGVVQQLYEQNMLTSECTTVMAGPSTGVISAAAPTLVPVNVVVPSNPVVPPPGPIFLDAESSATFLNSINPRKTKAKFGSVVKSGGKRKKKNA